jgi:hypothetical protein
LPRRLPSRARLNRTADAECEGENLLSFANRGRLGVARAGLEPFAERGPRDWMEEQMYKKVLIPIDHADCSVPVVRQ